MILGAGAIGSPQILQCSGVGDEALLQSLGIPVVHSLPGVGEGLQDHLQARLVYKTSLKTLNDKVNSLIKKAGIGLEYALFRKGPLTLAASQVVAFTRSNPGASRPDIQFHMQPLSADKPGEGPHKFSAFTASVCQLRPESRGHIKIKSPDPMQHPSIQPNYLSMQTDRRVAVAGIKMARKIASAPALARYITEEFVPESQHQTDAELEAA